ncbi:MAG: FAD-dependent oxidoreductase [Planctomycetes bacterium]|nr:FAD-dependent oxidoreductase [Planctomycetota bacterium]
MGTSLSFKRELPLRHDVDVMVAGGGPAGVTAALAAARGGASVLLVEAQSCFGGMGTAGGISMFCSMTDGVNFVADGLGREIHDRLHAAGGAAPGCAPNDQTLYFHPETLKRVYDDMMTGSPVKYVLLTSMTAVVAEGGVVDYVVCASKSGMYAARAKVYVDATGDGDLAAWAGADFAKGDAEGLTQPGTLVSLWGNIDWERANAAGNGRWRQDGKIKQAIADGVFTVRDPGMPGIIPTSPTCGNGNVGHLFGVDGTDADSLTAHAIRGRRMALEYGDYFRRYLTGYEKMELLATASQVGIRESRRIRGDYELTRDDYFRRAVFDDEIGRFCYAIDLHAAREGEFSKTNDDFKASWLPRGESYGIPYRVLTPVGLRNVLVAGRCVSADRAVQGSLRVMPGCFITGQAAGAAAAIAAAGSRDVHAVPVRELQQALLRLGAYLPNCPRD